MPDDIADILFVFLVNNLSAITQDRPLVLPTGLADLIQTEVLLSNGDLPFPSDLNNLLFAYQLTHSGRF